MAVIIFKPLEYCNSNCIYCAVIQKHQNVRMTYEILETTFIKMDAYLKEFPEETIEFTWHGGEACLLGPDYFHQALEYQRTHCPETQHRIRHLIQSNMTAITQDLIDVFKDLGIKTIGSSYDPIDGIRGIGKNRDSKLYKKLFFNGVDLVEKNGLSWGVIYVVHKKSLKDPVGLLNHLSNLNPGTAPIFNRIYIYDDDPYDLKVSPEEYAEFLGQLLPIYLKHPDRYGPIRPLSMYIDHLTKRSGLVCDNSGMCANNWLYIGPKGKLSQCGRAGDEDLIDYGNITEMSLKDALYHNKRDIIKERQEFLKKNNCRDCRFWGICHGGCPVDALAATGNIMNPSETCKMIKHFMTNYLEPQTGIEVKMYPDN